MANSHAILTTVCSENETKMPLHFIGEDPCESVLEFVKLPMEEILSYLKKTGAHLINVLSSQSDTGETTKVSPTTYIVRFDDNIDVFSPLSSQLKGLIFDHKTGEILSMTPPVVIDVKSIDNLPIDYTRVDEALDGTLLRYAFINGKWQLSTTNKFCASTAFWMNNVSFEKQFELAGGFTYIHGDSLNKNYVYMFILCHQLNVIVLNHTRSDIYHVATYDRTTMKEVPIDTVPFSSPIFYRGDDHIFVGVRVPKQTNLTPKQALNLAQKEFGKPVKSVGYMVVSMDGNGTVRRYRIENENYKKGRNLRGNHRNIDFAILQNMTNFTLVEFLDYYPMYRPDATRLIGRINDLVSKLYGEYCARFKSKFVFHVHPRHHKFLYEIHQKVYLDDLRTKKQTVYYKAVYDYVLKQDHPRIMYLLDYIYDFQ
jgi:hypothetical protein